MVRAYRRASQAGYRICNRCETEKTATLDNFVKDSRRALGVGYECLSCHSARRAGRDRSAERNSALGEEAKEKAIARRKRYSSTQRGRAAWMKARYRQMDSCNFPLDELVEFIAQPCTYCGTMDRPRGLDRIDTSKGHDRDNVLPSCMPCNSTRGAHRTPEETRAIVQGRMSSK